MSQLPAQKALPLLLRAGLMLLATSVPATLADNLDPDPTVERPGDLEPDKMAAPTDEFTLDSAGARAGFAIDRGMKAFHQAESFLTSRLPWGWEFGRGFRVQSRLDFSLGWLGDSHESAVIGAAGPGIVFTRNPLPISLEGGVTPVLMSRHNYGTRDLGSLFQVTSHVGLNVDITRHIRLGYRLQHMSNCGIASPNPGLNLHFFGVSYAF